MDNQKIRETPIKHVTPTEGFAFLSGQSGSYHNHPAIYACASDEGGWQLVVTSIRGEVIFPVDDSRPFEAMEKAVMRYAQELSSVPCYLQALPQEVKIIQGKL